MTIVLVLAVWWTALALFVLLKARRPRWDYPRPPQHAGRLEAEWPEAA